MSLTAFVPANTQKARTTAVSTFKRMLEDEQVSLEYAQASIVADKTGKRFAAIMDRFGFYLATHEGKKGYIQKQHVSVSADGVFYLRLLRVKTAEEQGLTLVPDKNNFLTYPLHALAVALATQDAPCGSLLSQLPELIPDQDSAPDPGTPLADLMEADPGTLNVALAAPSSSVTVSTTSGVSPTDTAATASPATLHLISRSKEPTRGEDVVQAYVNRHLKRVVTLAEAMEDLTSHSFRRGGAQHANGEEKLAAQSIFDRGAWDMTKANKAFAYVFNTPQEDRKVARVLSGWASTRSRL
ncbi:hypothetical protein PC128_g21193 [Phytophthora cactorum]|nr:hypothetical protein PC120_g6748 [Phytophthora cactorum]KAG3160015.1 hypothetical protein PC128_g21193 [Phytophthora cactorum]KAG4041452.1 hypothetical protein PC123_g23037 [Phytophthora cactorum]